MIIHDNDDIVNKGYRQTDNNVLVISLSPRLVSTRYKLSDKQGSRIMKGQITSSTLILEKQPIEVN